MIDRILSSLVALSLAFLVWLYARSRDQEMLDNVPVPVQISLAPGQASQYDLEVTGPAHVPVSFTGPPSRVRELRLMLQHGELHVDYTLAVPEDRQNEARYADTVRIDGGDVHPPPGVTATIAEERNRIPVTLHRIVERRLPVRFEHSGEDQLGQIALEPAHVMVRGPEEILERARAIATLPYVLPARPETAGAAENVTLGPVPLVHELEGRPVRTSPGRVMVRMTLQPKRRVYELTDVPVHFLCPTNFAFRPQFLGDGRAGKISLRVTGPAQAEPPAVHAFIDLTKGKSAAGLNHEPLRLQLPVDFQLDQQAPGVIGFELVPTEANTKGAGFVPGL